jgi:hypothetical protein
MTDPRLRLVVLLAGLMQSMRGMSALRSTLGVTLLTGVLVHCGGETGGAPQESPADAGDAGADQQSSVPPISVACCHGDGECPRGSICSSTLCLTPEAGACWRDLDCPVGERCIGLFICPCSADCEVDAIAGRCGIEPEAAPVPPCPGPPALPNGTPCPAAQLGAECAYGLGQGGGAYCLCERDGTTSSWRCQ